MLLRFVAEVLLLIAVYSICSRSCYLEVRGHSTAYVHGRFIWLRSGRRLFVVGRGVS